MKRSILEKVYLDPSLRRKRILKRILGVLGLLVVLGGADTILATWLLSQPPDQTRVLFTWSREATAYLVLPLAIMLTGIIIGSICLLVRFFSWSFGE